MISNNWELIKELNYFDRTSINYSDIHFYALDQASIQKFASAIGWRVVNVGDYVSEVSIHPSSSYDPALYDATDVYLIVPPDESNLSYHIGFTIGQITYHTSIYSTRSGVLLFDFESGTYLLNCELPDSNRPDYLWLLRPSATGCFAIRRESTVSIALLFDKFYNPKTEDTGWCVIGNNAYSYILLLDFVLGKAISATIVSTRLSVYNSLNFISLKKFTAIDEPGIYNAKTLYMGLVDYGSSIYKTIVVNGKRYCGVCFTHRDAYIAPMFYLELPADTRR